MNRTYAILLIPLVLLVGLVGFTPAVMARSSTSLQCEGSFQGTVTSGPDAGFTLVGDLSFTVSSTGSISGVLQQDDGPDLQVSGSVNNGQITLTFQLGNGNAITGTGSVDNPFTCAGTSTGTITGSLSGPAKVDTGNWCYTDGTSNTIF